MSVQADTQDVITAHLRAVRDLKRPAVSSVEAATRLGITRQRVPELIEAGELDGYGVPGEYRTRWYVYESALPNVTGGVVAPFSDDAVDDGIGLLKKIQEAIRAERASRLDAAEEARRAIGMLDEAIDAIQSRNAEDAAESQRCAAIAERRAATHEGVAQRCANDLASHIEKLASIVQRIGDRDGESIGRRPA